MAKKAGVILSGCGVQDGAEIHESVITLLTLDKLGAEIICMAPNKDQTTVVNHLTGKEMKEKRNVLVESARIARGNIREIKDVKASELDAIILPGGFGAALNLSTFAKEGKNCKVDDSVAKLLKDMHKAGKPIGAMCIAPAIIAKVLGGDFKPEITIGTDQNTFSALEAMGAVHRACPVLGIIIDTKNKIVTTPAYMLANRISEAASGIEKLVKAVLDLM